MKKILLAVIAISFAVLAGHPAAAQEKDPLDVVAPAAAPSADSPNWMQYKNPYATTTGDVSAANRTSDEILAWSQKAIAEALSFEAGKFNDSIKGNKRFFLKDGWAEYATYLKDSALLGVAQADQYYISTIVDGTPMIVNSGSMGGVFRWVVHVPIITTVNQTDKDGEQKPVSSSKIAIDVMVSRVSQGGVDGMAIERWRSNTADDKSVTK